ncbi:hypothetical protein F0L74_13550 [Chitinophaga agrisoli]|uniref:Uncharacterized protein n=1 Tax=Chitinophaga agrisoli TaxID=2607653 RepID=A0A5B2VYX6_9BACT|nr:hypothetical protein [Chitinophaga agrisoli]KAA2243512.1 hypothetical protein F0L74_13550 [Chitinophaga agrisoli]
MKLKLSKYVMVIPIPAFRDKPDADRLLFSTRTGKIMRISSHFLALLQEGAFLQLPDKLVAILLNMEILVPDEEAETDFIITRNLVRAADERDQSLTIPLRAPAKGEEFCYTSLQQDITQALAAMPPSSVKGFKYTVRLLLVVPHPMEWDWLPGLDAWLRSWQPPVKTQFILQTLAINEGCIELIIPRLQSVILNKLYVVFSHTQQPSGLTSALQSLLQQMQAPGGPTPAILHGVFLAGAGDWERWTPDLVDTLRVLSAQRNVHLEFITEEQEEPLLHFLTVNQVKSNWLPAPQHRYYRAAMEDSMQRTDLGWDAEDIRYMLSRASLEAGRVYYDTDHVKRLSNTTSPCRDCLYLPLCGGHADKLAMGIEDCPLFVRQLSARVAAGAGLSLR